MRLLQYFVIYLLLFSAKTAIGQVKIGNNPTVIDTNSILELESTNKGLLVPRIALNNVSLPAPLLAPVPTGMLVFNSSGSEPTGFYYWDGTKWVQLILQSNEPWRETGGTGATNLSTNIYYSNGNVRVGSTNTADNTLDVTGTAQISDTLFVGGKASYGNNGIDIIANGTNVILKSKADSTIISGNQTTGGTSRLVMDNVSGQIRMPAYVQDSFYTSGTVTATNMLALEANGKLVELPNLKRSYVEGNVTTATVYGNVSGTKINLTETYDTENIFASSTDYTVPFSGVYTVQMTIIGTTGGVSSAATIDFATAYSATSPTRTASSPVLLGTTAVYTYTLTKYLVKDAVYSFYIIMSGTSLTTTGGYGSIHCLSAF